MAQTGTRGQGDDEGYPIVDCDVHVPADGEAIAERMPEPFRSKGLSGPGNGYSSPVGVVRRDTSAADASRLELTRRQMLDPMGIEHAIITSGAGGGLVALENARLAVEIMRASNDWLIDEWTSRDPRIHGSIGVVPHAPEKSAEEIHRLGDHPDMVQVITGSGTRIPIGQRDYWPIFEAAEAKGLPVAMHIGPKGDCGIGHPNNPAGHASTYGEAHIAQSINYYGQLASLVCEGVFEEFPDLEFVLIEGEFGWVPDILWRLDRNWERLQDEVPWLDRRPSEYVREHVRFTTQPIPEPPKREYLLHLLEMINAEETLLFCTDYPHWDGDYSPKQVFPGLPESMERAIFFENANELYGF